MIKIKNVKNNKNKIDSIINAKLKTVLKKKPWI